jgi:hypothetical protein
MAGYSSVGADPFSFPQRRADSTFQLADTVSVTHGRQTFTAGAEGWMIFLNSNVNQNARPTVSFYGEPLSTENRAPAIHFGTLMDPTSLVAIGLEGNVFQTFTTTSNTSLNLYRPQLDLFIQDDVRVTRSLTLNLGFRFSVNGAPTSRRFEDTYGPNGTFLSDLNSVNRACLASQPQGACSRPYSDLQNAFPPGFDQVYRAAPFGYNPRIGLAWDPVGHGNIVIRAGYGNYSGQLPAEIISESSGLFPQVLPLWYASGRINFFRNMGGPNSPVPIVPGTLNLLPSGTNLVCLLNTFQTSCPPTPSGSILSDAWIAPVEPGAGLKNPSVQAFGLTLDQSIGQNMLLSAAYVGNLVRHLPQANQPNATVPQTLYLASSNLYFPCASPLQGPCPYFNIGQGGHTNLADPTVYSSTATSEYQSLQLQLRLQRAWLQASSALTWSHSIDDASDIFDTAGSFALPQDPRNLSAERASSNFDTRLRSVSYFTAASGSKNPFFARWKFSGILTLQTGQPFTVNTVYDLSVNGLHTDRLQTTQGLAGPGVGIDVPDLGRQTRLVFTDPSLADPANRAAQFLCHPLPCFGAVGRNTFRAAGLEQLDLALSRNFGVKGLPKGHMVQLRLEGYNVLNRTNFAIPVRILEAPGFGSSVSTVGTNRRLQFSIKYFF